jgi:hypothetical protein
VKAPPGKQNAMLGGWMAIAHDQAQKAEALDRDRRTRLAFQQYNKAIEQEQYARNFVPSGGTIPVPTGREISPLAQAQATGAPGVGVYSPDFTVPETEPYRYIKKGPSGETEIIPPPFSPNIATVTPPGQAPINLMQTSPRQYQVTPGSQPVSPMMGQVYYHPDTGKAIGVYDENGRVQFFPQANPMEAMLASVYGINPTGGAPPAGPPGPPPATGQRVPSGQPQPTPAQGQPGRPLPPDLRQKASTAIKQGADPNAVRARLQQAGYDASEF